MTNLAKLTKIREQYAEQTGEPLTHKKLVELTGRSVFTVAHWFDKSQTRPIPDDTLELLAYKIAAKTQAMGLKK